MAHFILMLDLKECFSQLSVNTSFLAAHCRCFLPPTTIDPTSIFPI